MSALVSRGMGLVDAADPLRGLVYLTHALKLERDAGRERVHRMRLASVRGRSPRLVRLWNHGAFLGGSGFDATTDGLVATGGIDGIARLWSSQQDGLVRALQHGAAMIGVDLTEDGALLLTAGEDGVVQVWRTADGHRLAQPLRHDRLTTARFSPDGRWLATGGADGTIKVWDPSTGATVCEARHKASISFLRFAPDSRYLATASAEPSVGLWALPRCVSATPVLQHDSQFRNASLNSIADVAFSADGRLIATAGNDQTVRLWDATSGEPAMPPLRHRDNASAIEFSKDGTHLVTTSVDRMTTMWRVADGMAVPSRQGSGVGEDVDVSTHGMIATGSSGGDVDIWTPEGHRVALLPHSSDSEVRFLSSGRLLVTASMDGLVRVWDLAPALPRPPALQSNEGDGAYQLAFSPDGKALALLSLRGGQIRVLDVENGVPAAPFIGYTVADFDFSRDGRHLVTAQQQRLARVWDFHTGEPRTPAVQHDERVRSVRFSPDGKNVASAGGSDTTGLGELRVWDAATGQMQFDPQHPDGRVVSLEFTPDGRRVLTAATRGQGNLTLWDVVTGRIVARASHAMSAPTEFARISQTGGEVWSVGNDQRVRVWRLSAGDTDPAPKLLLGGAPTVLRLSPDNRNVAVGTFGGEIRVGDTRTMTMRAWPMRHGSLVYTTAFSPDGSVLVTSGGDGVARAWDVATGEPMTPWLTTGVQFPRYAAVAPGGKAWAYVGDGVFLETFEEATGSVADLVERAELDAAQTVTSAVHTPLSAADVEARWAGQSRGTTADPARELWLRWLARFEWRRGRMPQVLTALQELQSITPLRWPEVMERLGAFASLNRWNDAVGELAAYRSWHAGAPELAFIDAIARLRSGERAAATTSCRQQLSAHGDTQNPDRAAWIVRICLLAGTDDAVDWQTVGRLAERAPNFMRDRLSRQILASAVLVRQRRFSEAVEQLRQSTVARPQAPTAPLYLALAEAQAGGASAARAMLERKIADPLNEFEAVSWLRPWFHAEAELLREEVIAALAQKR